eukprot:TRINITY_DN948_c0_g1_i2.p1 TRINITY_DN948_c0_g1~~TRINITY_DN948_c0_g1_i2.p1  ORF type:complete len:725 (+),score=127.06 TRINITY_DN948_c0_g1_i2:231-2177(+)
MDKLKKNNTKTVLEPELDELSHQPPQRPESNTHSSISDSNVIQIGALTEHIKPPTPLPNYPKHLITKPPKLPPHAMVRPGFQDPTFEAKVERLRRTFEPQFKQMNRLPLYKKIFLALSALVQIIHQRLYLPPEPSTNNVSSTFMKVSGTTFKVMQFGSLGEFMKKHHPPLIPMKGNERDNFWSVDETFCDDHKLLEHSIKSVHLHVPTPTGKTIRVPESSKSNTPLSIVQPVPVNNNNVHTFPHKRSLPHRQGQEQTKGQPVSLPSPSPSGSVSVSVSVSGSESRPMSPVRPSISRSPPSQKINKNKETTLTSSSSKTKNLPGFGPELGSGPPSNKKKVEPASVHLLKKAKAKAHGQRKSQKNKKQPHPQPQPQPEQLSLDSSSSVKLRTFAECFPFLAPTNSSTLDGETFLDASKLTLSPQYILPSYVPVSPPPSSPQHQHQHQPSPIHPLSPSPFVPMPVPAPAGPSMLLRSPSEPQLIELDHNKRQVHASLPANTGVGGPGYVGQVGRRPWNSWKNHCLVTRSPPLSTEEFLDSIVLPPRMSRFQDPFQVLDQNQNQDLSHIKSDSDWLGERLGLGVEVGMPPVVSTSSELHVQLSPSHPQPQTLSAHPLPSPVSRFFFSPSCGDSSFFFCLTHFPYYDFFCSFC